MGDLFYYLSSHIQFEWIKVAAVLCTPQKMKIIPAATLALIILLHRPAIFMLCVKSLSCIPLHAAWRHCTQGVEGNEAAESYIHKRAGKSLYDPANMNYLLEASLAHLIRKDRALRGRGYEDDKVRQVLVVQQRRATVASSPVRQVPGLGSPV